MYSRTAVKPGVVPTIEMLSNVTGPLIFCVVFCSADITADARYTGFDDRHIDHIPGWVDLTKAITGTPPAPGPAR